MLFLLAGGIVLYLLSPQIVDVLASAPRLESVRWVWLAAMFGLEVGSFVAAWQLARIAVPGLSWFSASTSQLAANAVSRSVPGGAMVGSAAYYRLLERAGTKPAEAAAALTANSLVSNLVLFALPAAGAIGAAVTSVVPPGLLPVALGGIVLFAMTFGLGAAFVVFDRPLLLLGRLIARVRTLFTRRHLPFDPRPLLRTRDDIVVSIGRRWPWALGSATANWLLDYLVLFVALYAVGAEPRLSLVLLAYGGAAVLGMIPITPGGLGFVEAGLTATLTVAGVPAGDALLATLAYRIMSFWLPLPAGLAAYLLHRRRYGGPSG